MEHLHVETCSGIMFHFISSYPRNLRVALKRSSIEFYDYRHQIENAICRFLFQKVRRKFCETKMLSTSFACPQLHHRYPIKVNGSLEARCYADHRRDTMQLSRVEIMILSGVEM
ncbi:hypothetical protein DICVIV_12125 [Dictyocaulus viviparus]|uniref:Uncharacterized protein n=1 Tax=Dictyocaulus viviparus TaxID=29172 RepID=A0A0D8XHT2_DICVI|nr:hypothetical protein DICVIV_12125 [Dictyocaulus viviparus]